MQTTLICNGNMKIEDDHAKTLSIIAFVIAANTANDGRGCVPSAVGQCDRSDLDERYCRY